MLAACFSIMRGDDWQRRDGVGVEGHLASIHLISKHFIYLFIYPYALETTPVTKNKQTRLFPWDFLLFPFSIFFFCSTENILFSSAPTFFNYLSHLPGQSNYRPRLEIQDGERRRWNRILSSVAGLRCVTINVMDMRVCNPWTNERVLDYSANAQGRQDCNHYWTVGRRLTTKGDTP